MADNQARQPKLGQTIGRYRIESQIGEGGMGLVYKACGDDGRPVALKVVKAELANDDVFRRRFDREANAAARIKHPHVVGVVEAGEHEGIPFIAQEYLGGGTLKDLIEVDGRLRADSMVRITSEVAKGLDSLHAEGIVHRDVKPENILFDDQRHAHVSYFGLAKDRAATVLTKPGQALGSLDYMAPEQIRGTEVGPATDVYALGCVAFECVAGSPPFADRTGMQVLWAHLQDEPPDPCADRDDVPADIGWAITRALAKEPEGRPATATGFARILQAAMGPAG